MIQVACTSDTTLSWRGGGGSIKVGIYCALSNDLKISTGFDQASVYFVTDSHKIQKR